MLLTSKSISEKLSLQMMEYISVGVYQPEEKLPSVRELSNLYHVNPNTISKVYQGLEEQGYIYSIPAKGYYVSSTCEKTKEKTAKQMQEIFHLLYVLSTLAGMSLEEVTQKMKEQFETEGKLYD